jgi:hypothetical protein
MIDAINLSSRFRSLSPIWTFCKSSVLVLDSKAPCVRFLDFRDLSDRLQLAVYKFLQSNLFFPEVLSIKPSSFICRHSVKSVFYFSRHHIPTMSSTLNPSYATIATIRNSIQSTLKADLPSDVLANVIAPYLITVNQWSSQIPAMLESSGPLNCANLVFAIRKDLFIAPLYTSSTLGIPLSGLPAPFQEFINFIHKLIEAQKTERDKPIVKVCTVATVLFSSF